MSHKKECIAVQSDPLAIFKFDRDQALAENVPSYLAAHRGNKAGRDNMDADDIIVPRLSIAQEGMTAQMKKSSESYLPDLNAGDFFNTVTNEIYGKKVHVVPILFFKNYIKFAKEGGIEAMFNHVSEVPKGALDFKGGVPPEVTEFKNRLCLLVKENFKPTPIVVSFKSTGLKFAKQWNSLIQATNLPAFARSYELNTFERKRGTQSWFLCQVKPHVFVPESFFSGAELTFKQFEKMGFKVDTSGLDTDESGSASTAVDEDIPF
jgi:hypothetical protein